MLLFEYDREKALKAERAEGFEEGFKLGFEEGRLEAMSLRILRKLGMLEGIKKTILELNNDGILSAEEATERLKIVADEFKKKLINWEKS